MIVDSPSPSTIRAEVWSGPRAKEVQARLGSPRDRRLRTALEERLRTLNQASCKGC
ncbi:hypothetical protein J7E96_18640 [Streptomyces sp. ISL-96]|uniref:hypothetical protein n=1 Tax=Streptomyces sp. ISL-96 TaxID=2819191 RepID=UPI001BE53C46|nr:hypothetical protein [Streptomyces sp. ISL-96]MBT2490497.1 hypothetical protein [Streptomyces sp. ISL-96]